MPATITALELITRSMRLVNALAAGEQPTAEDANDGLQTLNELIDGWSAQSLMVYGGANDEFITVPGKSLYTFGTGGDINADRPIYVSDAYCIRQDVTTTVRLITQIEHNSIAIKSTSQPLVEQLLFINDFPLATVTLWPVPSEAVTIGMSTGRILANITSLQQLIYLPPGYLRAMRYNLAVDLWPEYSNKLTDIGQIRMIAAKSLGDVKRGNSGDDEMDFSSVPMVEGGRSWDWRASS